MQLQYQLKTRLRDLSLDIRKMHSLIRSEKTLNAFVCTNKN